MPPDMLMFNIRQILKLLKPCTLCHQTWHKYQKTSLCINCWKQLRIQPTLITKRDISIHVATSYDFPINRLLQQFKYQHALHHTDIFKDVLARVNISQVQAIVPMPISIQRLQQRGYNQAYILAKILAEQYKLPIWMPIERQHTHQQKNLGRLERIQYIESQFKINQKIRLCYRRVVIIDDVVTTGSSIYALKNKLHELGCKQVDVICLAYTI